MLSETINSSLRVALITEDDLKQVVVDSTVQEKNITYPTDSKLYGKARKLLVDIAKCYQIVSGKSRSHSIPAICL